MILSRTDACTLIEFACSGNETISSVRWRHLAGCHLLEALQEHPVHQHEPVVGGEQVAAATMLEASSG